MDWGAIGSGLSSLGNAASPFIQFGLNKGIAGQSWDRQKDAMTRRYQWLVGDLERAGLNRMLAIGGASPPSGSAPMAASQGDVKIDPLVLKQREKLIQDTKLSRAGTDAASELSRKTGHEAEGAAYAAAREKLVLDEARMKSNRAKALFQFEQKHPWVIPAIEYGVPAANALQQLGREAREWFGLGLDLVDPFEEVPAEPDERWQTKDKSRSDGSWEREETRETRKKGRPATKRRRGFGRKR